MNAPRMLLAMTFLAIGLTQIPLEAHAGARRFVWSYESTTTPRGLGEYEQWVTWKTDKESDDLYDRLEFRQEFEYGLGDRLQVGLYFADWRYTRSSSGSDTEVRTSALEIIWNLADPAISPLGVGLYGEIAFGQEKFELEGKILLEKSFGPLVIVANTILEAEWEDEDWIEDKGKFEQTLGISRQFSPRVLVGAEALYEVEFDDWGEAGEGLVYAGPTLSLRQPRWWVTTSPLFQLTSNEGEPDLTWRTLVGVPF